MNYVKEINDAATGERAVVWDWDILGVEAFNSLGDRNIGHIAYNKTTSAAVQDNDLQKFVALEARAATSGKPPKPHIIAASSENLIVSLFDKIDEIRMMSDLHLTYLARASDEVRGGVGRALQLAVNPLLLREVEGIKVFSTRALVHNLKSCPTPRPRSALNRAMDLHEDRRMAPYFLPNPSGSPYLRADVKPDAFGENLLKIGKEHRQVSRSLRIGEVTVGGLVQCLNELITGNRFMTPEEFFGDNPYL